MNILIKNVNTLIGSEVQTADIYVKDEYIAGINAAPEGFIPDKTIDGSDKLAIPGLVNSHTHSYMSVFRNLADDLSFDEWLFKSIMPREDNMRPEEAYWGAMLSCMEMLKTGTTCFMNMHIFPGMDAAAADKMGLKAVMTRGLVGSDRKDEGGLRRLREHMEERDRFKDNPRIKFKLGPHAIYTCGQDYLEYLLQTAKETDQQFHIHLSESAGEVQNCYKEHGKSPVEYLDDMGFFDVPTAAAHCVHVSEGDMDIMAKRGVSVLHNPKSNLKLANGTAPVPRMVEKGINVCIGTDSQASNNNLNMFSDMNFAALLPKGATAVPTVCAAREVLKFATVNGAKALGFSDTGEIAEGKKADIVLLDLLRPEFYPRVNLTAALVYSANGSEVDTVMVDGRILLENGRLTEFDEAEIYAKVEEAAKRLSC
ncbi:MAG: amidohydrolase [Oscillospiraceae bacterium]|nr:amidohydrolase [Oscillospiraceae bacterium]